MRKDIEAAGRITEQQIKELGPFPGGPNDIVLKLAAMLQAFNANPKNLSPEKLRARHLRETLEYLDSQISEFKKLIGERQEQIDIEDSMRHAVAMLPSGEILDKIVRYESALQRQLNRSMNQLERLQRRRLGDHVPAPVAMDITLKE